MKQLSIADELFNSSKQMQKIFSNDMASYSSGACIQNTPLDYVCMLEKLHSILEILGLRVDHMEENIANLNILASQLELQGNFLKYVKGFYQAINSILSEVIKYREYYCIIRRNDPIPGLASHIITNLGQIVSGIAEGYIPVIDMVNVDNCFTSLSQETRQNSWELFFQQPFGTSLSPEVMAHKYIVKDGIPAFMPNYQMDFLTNMEIVDIWRQVMKRYMPFSSAIREKIRKIISNSPFRKKQRILGVLCRGTDYTALRPYNHPVQPSVEEVLKKVTEIMATQQCEIIYLATEDAKVLSAFQEHFQNKVFTTQNFYYSHEDRETLASINRNMNIDFYAKNEEYLIALYLLSQCDCFVGGRTSGSVVSLLLSEGYDYFYVWNKGRYGIDDVFSVSVF